MARWIYLAGAGALLLAGWRQTGIGRPACCFGAGVLAARGLLGAVRQPASRSVPRRRRRDPPEWISDLPVGPDGRPPLDALIDKTLADSFPASDPPGYWSGPPEAAR